VIGEPSSADVAVFGAGVDPNVSVPPTSFAVARRLARNAVSRGRPDHGVDPFASVYVAPKSTLANPADDPVEARHPARGQGDQRGGPRQHGLRAHRQGRAALQIVKFDILTGSIAQATTVVAAGSRVIDGIANASDALYVLSREDGLGASRASATTA